MAKASSSAYRVFDVGIEHNVKSFRSEWKETSSTDGKKPKKYLATEPAAPDAMLAYADIVLISDSTIEGYQKAVAWQQQSIGLPFSEATKLRKEGTAYCSVLRVYWYHNGTNGQHHGNCGFADLLNATTLPDAVKASVINEGNKGASEAFTVMRKIMGVHQSKATTGSHLAVRMFTSLIRPLGRSIITGLADGRNFNWDKGSLGNRGRAHSWQEGIHGKVMDKLWEINQSRKATDSSMGALADALCPGGVESVATPVATVETTSKIVEFDYKSPTGKDWKGYRLPDGTEVTCMDRGFNSVREEFWRQEGLLEDENNQTGEE